MTKKYNKTITIDKETEEWIKSYGGGNFSKGLVRIVSIVRERAASQDAKMVHALHQAAKILSPWMNLSDEDSFEDLEL